MVQLLRKRPYLLPSFTRFRVPLLRMLLTTGSAFMVAQIATFIYQSFSVFWAGRELGPTSAATVAVMFLLMSLAGSVTLMITQPLWPAIQDAVSRSDAGWVRRTYGRLVGVLMIYALMVALVFTLAGDRIIGHWLKEMPILPSALFVLWGVYYFLVTWEHVNYMVLNGLSRFWFGSMWFLAGAVIMLVACIVMMPSYGLVGLFAALCLGPLVTTVWRYPIAVKQEINGLFQALGTQSL